MRHSVTARRVVPLIRDEGDAAFVRALLALAKHWGCPDDMVMIPYLTAKAKALGCPSDEDPLNFMADRTPLGLLH